ncbi:hypothetical protein [Pedobacter ghigonis]|uniref:hypothetical protein n=1 Tax=Pedobacter ghigonis TaxID=2730403 RepID=UPI00158EA910|nr:hypothetical protein [Pedobacter ghigonis]
MKQIIMTLLGFFIITQYTLAQPSKLDAKNGFNVLVLGSTVKQVKATVSIQKIKQDVEDNFTYFNVKNVERYKLIGETLSAIQLVFYNDRLLEIDLFLPDNVTAKQTFTEYEIADKISKEYGKWNERELSATDRLDLTSKFDITGDKVTLIRYRYKVKSDNYRIYIPGNRYAFISHEVSNAITSKEGNGL